MPARHGLQAASGFPIRSDGPLFGKDERPMRRTTVHLAPADLSLLAAPLEFIRADHDRQHALCNLMEELAEAPRLDVDKAKAVIAYLNRDMRVHVIDEEEDLYPLLRRRCRPEDDVASVLGMLSGEHADDRRLAAEIGEALAKVADAKTAVRDHADLRSKMLMFVEKARRHLDIENRSVLPLARKRLTDHDKTCFAQRLAARRGRPPPTGNS